MSGYFYYYVHETTDPDSPVIAEGMSGKIKEFLGINYNMVALICTKRNGIFNGTNLIERVRLNDKQNNTSAQRKQSKFNERIDEIEHLLDIYGNTIIYKDLEKVFDRLNADGYFVTATHEIRREIKSKNPAAWDNEVYDECWILELVRREIVDNV